VSSDFQLFPIIELRDGAPLKRLEGTNGSALETALAFEERGADGIGIVDIDAEVSGRSRSRVVLSALANEVKIPIAAVGGVVDRYSAEAMFDTGVGAVVTSPSAANEAGLIEWLSLRFPGRVSVGLDAEAHNPMEVIEHLRSTMVASYSISASSPLDAEALVVRVLSATDVPVFAPESNTGMPGIRRLAGLAVAGHRRLAGLKLGRIAYSSDFSFSETSQLCQSERL